MARIVFMGSPEFARPFLMALAEAHQVVGVVTQPDRPAGRGSTLRASAVKVAAQGLGLPVFQPERMDEAALSTLRAWDPQVVVVVAFGQLLTSDVLTLPPHGCVNVHTSLLPRWRGAAPVTAAILAGDAVTGVTVMKLDEGLDTGPILAQREEPIRADDTTASLLARLGHVGIALLLETLPAYLAGYITPRPQPGTGVTVCERLEKKDGRLEWTRSAVELDRQVRAFVPWPRAFTTWNGERLVIHRAVPIPEWTGEAAPGTVIPLGDGAAVATGQGALWLVEVQRAGKKALPIEVFIRGQQGFVGAVLG
ncbi:MAG: methionyl-tRNA formyltransferase [Anaerolineae bacterium]|nr:methionyl-tRNA formyltransferase [Anaerolineae bacterium]